MRKRFWQVALTLGAATVILLGNHLCSRLLSQTPPPPPSDNNYAQPPQGGGQEPAGEQAGPEVLPAGRSTRRLPRSSPTIPSPARSSPNNLPSRSRRCLPRKNRKAIIPGSPATGPGTRTATILSGSPARGGFPRPATTWVPGYWNQAANGHQWVSGYWGPAAAAGRASATSETVYLPPPPQSVEAGASTAASLARPFLGARLLVLG